MNWPRLIRGLRIAFSTVCGLVCVLLICLWGRSYSHRDTFSGPSRKSGGTYFFSQAGEVQYWCDPETAPDGGWEFITYPLQESAERLSLHSGHWYENDGYLISLVVPYWVFLLVAALFAAVPWLPRKRFSLRTLLIATTLVAVVLGLIVAVLR